MASIVPPPARPFPGQRPPPIRLHHIKLAVARLDVSLIWYERVLGARRISELDHTRPDGTRYAVVCELTEASGLFFELRENETQAGKARGWDPITFLVRSRDDLVAWMNWLDTWGSVRSPLMVGHRGWILVFEDPDGRRFRIYTQDHHDGSLVASTDNQWLPES